MVSFSISILSKGRIDCLKALFASLDRERNLNPNVAVEVNVFDDSSDAERVIIKKTCEDCGFNYFYYEGSIAAKRNEAIRKATHEVIWFVDSDCEPKEGVLRAFVDSYNDSSTQGVLGVVEFKGGKPFFWKLIEKAGFTTSFSFATFMDYAIWGPCANICYRKKDLEAIGGFKKEFPYNYSGEDVDVGVRHFKSGCRLKCNPNAVVNHSTSTWLKIGSFCKKVFRWGRTDYYLMRDHYDMTYVEYPRFVCVLFLTCLLAILPHCSWLFPLLFLLVTPPLFWLCQIFVGETRPGNMIVNCLAFYLKQAFELGFVMECLWHFRFGYLFKKILYGDRQLAYEITDRNCLAIASLLSMMISITVAYLV